MKKGFKSTVLMVTLASLTLAGCSAGKTAAPSTSSSAASAAPDKQILVGATLMDAQSQWFQWVKQGMEDAAQKNNAKLEVVNTQGDPAKEISAVENLAQKGVNAMAIGASSATASANALKQAEGKGIKIIAYNSIVGEEGHYPFVGVDNKQLGVLNGNAAKKTIVEKFGGKAKVAIIYQPKYGNISLARTDGFEEVVKTVPGVEIVDKQIAESQEQAQNIVQNILTAHPDVNIIDCWNESSFEGSLAAVKSAGKASSVLVYGVDMSPKVTQAFMTENDIGAVATQEPYNIGYTAVETAIKSARGENVAKDTRVPVASVTKDTLDEFLKTHTYYKP